MAAQKYDKALVEANRYVANPAQAVMALGIEGTALARLGRTAEADAEFQEAFKGKPDEAQSASLRHRLVEGYGGLTRACDVLQRWVQDQKLADVTSKLSLGILYIQAGENSKAIKVLEEIRDQPGDKVSLGVWLAEAYQGNKDLAKSEQAYLDVLKSEPGNLQALNNLAYLYADDLKSPAKALPYAKKAMEILPGNGNVLDTYGWVLFLAGDRERAIEILQRAVATLQPAPIFFYHLGTVFEQDKQLQRALDQYERGLKLPGPQGSEQPLEASARKDMERARDRVNQQIQSESGT